MLLNTIRVIIFIILVQVLIHQPLIAQNQTIHNFKRITEENGLSSNYIKSIIADSTGLIWIATDKGICTFNHKEFNPYRLEKFNDRIDEIFIDENDLIWVKYDKTSSLDDIPSIQILDPHNQTLNKVEDRFSYSSQFNSNDINSIWSDKSKRIILCGTNEHKFITSNDSIFLACTVSQHSLDKSNFYDGIIILSPNNQNLIDCNHNVIDEKKRLNLKLKITSQNHKFTLFFKNQKQQLEEKELELDFNFNPQQKKYFNYPNLYFFKSNNLVRYNIETNIVTNYKDQIEEIGSNIHITSILEYNNKLFLGTNKGMLIVNEYPNFFNNQLSNQYISTRNIVQLSNDSLLISTFQGLFIHDLNSGVSEKIINSLHGYGITRISECEYIIGTYGGRYFEVDICNALPKVKSFKTSFTFYKMHSKEWPFVASISGLLYFEESKNDVVLHKFKNGVFKGNVVDFYTIKEDSIIWALTTTGIVEIDVLDNSFSRLPHINDYHIKCIYKQKDKKSSYLIGTHRNGILEYDKEIGIKRVFTEKNGLSNNTIHSIMADSISRVWISTNDGINIFFPKTKEFISIYKNLGFSTDEFNSFSSLEMTNGRFVLGSIDGITVFNPYEFKIGASSNVITIEKVIYTDDENVETINFLNEGDKIIIGKNLKEKIEIEIEIKSDENSTRFPNYRFLIPGVINEWVYPPNNLISLPNLKYGNYELLISRKDDLNSWSPSQTFNINITKPLYKNNWFYVFLIALILLLIIYILNYLRKRTERRNIKIQEEIKLKTQQLSKTNESLISINEFNETLFAVLGHDLRSPLMAFNNISKKLNYLKRKKDEEGVLKLINSLETQSYNLLDEIENLLAWAVLQRKSNAPIFKNFVLNQVIAEVIDANQNAIEHKSIQLNFEAVEINCVSDKEAIKVIFRNIFLNALKHTPNGKIITVRIGSDTTNNPYFEVEDAGSGIPESIVERINTGKKLIGSNSNSNNYGNGIGLIISSTLIKRIGSKIEINNSSNYGAKVRVII